MAEDNRTAEKAAKEIKESYLAGDLTIQQFIMAVDKIVRADESLVPLVKVIDEQHMWPLCDWAIDMAKKYEYDPEYDLAYIMEMAENFCFAEKTMPGIIDKALSSNRALLEFVLSSDPLRMTVFASEIEKQGRKDEYLAAADHAKEYMASLAEMAGDGRDNVYVQMTDRFIDYLTSLVNTADTREPMSLDFELTEELQKDLIKLDESFGVEWRNEADKGGNPETGHTIEGDISTAATELENLSGREPFEIHDYELIPPFLASITSEERAGYILSLMNLIDEKGIWDKWHHAEELMRAADVSSDEVSVPSGSELAELMSKLERTYKELNWQTGDNSDNNNILKGLMGL